MCLQGKFTNVLIKAPVADSGLYAFGHIAREDMEHTLGEAYLLVAAIHGAHVSRHTFEVRIDTSAGAGGIGHVLPYLPSQALGAQRALVLITNGVAFFGFLNQ